MTSRIKYGEVQSNSGFRIINLSEISVQRCIITMMIHSIGGPTVIKCYNRNYFLFVAADICHYKGNATFTVFPEPPHFVQVDCILAKFA